MTGDEINELKAFLGERFESIDERFESIDERFERMDQRFDGMDRRFDGIDQRFDGMDRRFDGMDLEHRDLVHLLGKRFTSIDERFESLDEGVRKNGVTLEEVRGELKLATEHVLANADKIEGTKAELVKEIEGVDEKVSFLGEELVPRVKALEDR